MNNRTGSTRGPRQSTTVIDSPVGPLGLVATATGLMEIRFLADRSDRPGCAEGEKEATRILREAESQLTDYFNGRRTTFDLPLVPVGTEFQCAVWTALCEIPFGTTQSYGELARRIGRARAVRAVGAANGANPLPVVVPCHRVIGANGSLTGYGGGLDIKRHLLTLEGVPLAGDRLA